METRTSRLYQDRVAAALKKMKRQKATVDIGFM